jgi:hypothetical protein
LQCQAGHEEKGIRPRAKKEKGKKLKRDNIRNAKDSNNLKKGLIL